MEITCVLCNYLADCTYVYLKGNGWGCNYEELCRGQRPLRFTVDNKKKEKP